MHPFDHPLGRLDVQGDLPLDKRLHHEGLEELKGHLLGKAALVKLQVRSNNDD